MPEADAAIRQAVVARAKERGLDVNADDLTVEYLEGHALGDLVVFRAWFTFRDMREAVTGVVKDGRVIANSYEAMDAVFGAWESAGDELSALDKAIVAAWIIGGGGRQRLAVDQTTADEISEDGRAPGVASPPEHAGAGVRFWWHSRAGLSRVTVTRGDYGLSIDDETARDIED